MKTSNSFLLTLYTTLTILALTPQPSLSQSIIDQFYQCINLNSDLAVPFSSSFYSADNSSFSAVLESTAQNLRRLVPSVPKPLLIFTPFIENQVQATVTCTRALGLLLRVRSGGHDYEGLSYSSESKDEPFVLLDLSRLRSITVDPNEKTATLEQNATKILARWQQVADTIDEDLFLRVIIQRSKNTISNLYNAVFFGKAERLIRVMDESFPELGLKRKDCTEMSWIESIMYITGYPSGTPPETLLQGKSLFKNYFKAKSDYVMNAITEEGLEGLWTRLLDEETPLMILTPYGGMMSRIPEDETPFPHRKGVKYMIQYVTTWNDDKPESQARHMDWIRRVYNYMGPHVSMLPRQAYVNYRDLDLGMNKNGTSFIEAASWGARYFKDNFDRLVKVKTMVDKENFFRHEQSIPILPLMRERRSGKTVFH
ncbi:FAD-binding Berberine family protein [Striga asiatica]|uniref:FAD-binding Berberine family protein n=1 Tax=Striga asiatica TaxID=4170 RepID=A0A5A7NWG8_STRAF|nr:FAD-binding Berberine family protein [Striga asiatica]